MQEDTKTKDAPLLLYCLTVNIFINSFRNVAEHNNNLYFIYIIPSTQNSNDREIMESTLKKKEKK